MPDSASHPNEWLRLPGCPNRSVKYGIIASSTRGSTGVVELLSMKIGNFTAMSAVSSVPHRDESRHHGRRLVQGIHRFQRHGLQNRSMPVWIARTGRRMLQRSSCAHCIVR